MTSLVDLAPLPIYKLQTGALVAVSACTLLLSGVLLGRIMTLRSIQTDDLILRSDAGGTISVVEIDGVQDGRLRGSIQGDARVFLQGTELLANEEGVFDASASSLFINYVRVVVPEGMHYVASKRGSKYYSVTSATGNNIVPENRVYFATAEEAQKAGFRP